MKKRLAPLLLVLASYAGWVTLVQAAEEPKPAAAETKSAEPADKPLEPGWLSLDCCVGPLDSAIANGKGALEKALGIAISGFFDTSYTWSSNHPDSPSNISGRYFDKDYNKVVFNYFHIAVEKPASTMVTITSSPGEMPLTPSPTASITPLPSCPSFGPAASS